MNPLESINNIVRSAQPSQVRWLVCRDCGTVIEHDFAHLPPAVCSSCGSKSNHVVLPNPEKAKEAAAQFTKADAPLPPGVLKEVVPPPAKVEPLTPAPDKVDPPAPAPKRTRKANPVTQVVATVAPAIHPSEVSPGDQIDWEAQRNAAREALTAKFGLNPVEWKPVGTGVIYTFGFSAWEGSRPVYGWMELTDTPQSFRAVFDEARASYPAAAMDAAKVTALPEELVPLAFQGMLTATLRPMMAAGGIRATVNAKVTIGAKLSKSGSVVFAVLGVSR